MDLLRFKKRRLRGYLIAACSYLMGESRKDRDRLFSEMHSDRMKGNRQKLEYKTFSLYIRIYFFFSESNHILAQVTLRGCGLCLLVDI